MAVEVSFIGQPSHGHVLHSLGVVVDHGRYTAMRAAVAYVTVGGVSDFVARCDPSALAALNKRWLVGIDWFRSDPSALDALESMTTSEVRVHDGDRVSQRASCHPYSSFHPKAFMLHGPNGRALLAGSANASSNGFHWGVEANLLLEVDAGDTSEAQIAMAETWFDGLWASATPWPTIASRYRAAHTAAQANRPVLLDDDAAPSARVGAQRSFTAEDLARLRASEVFWMQAGNLHQNRGPGIPGNQLMMRSMTRVYFGFPASDVGTDTLIGFISIAVNGGTHPDRTIRFSNNSMDVLALPVPGAVGAPTAYDQEVLVFRRRPGTSPALFDLRLGQIGELPRLRRRSQRQEPHWTMSSGREFGTF